MYRSADPAGLGMCSIPQYRSEGPADPSCAVSSGQSAGRQTCHSCHCEAEEATQSRILPASGNAAPSPELAGLYSNPLLQIQKHKRKFEKTKISQPSCPKFEPPTSQFIESTDSITQDRVVNKYEEVEVRKYRQKQKRLSNTEKAEIIQRYQSGENTNQLAAAYGCHRNTISNTLKKAGIDVTIKKIGIVFEPEEAIELYTKGWKSKDIGKKLGVSELTIRKCLRERGVKIRNRWDYPRE